MGIGFALLFWAVIAALGACVFGCSTAAFTRGVPNGRRKVILAAVLFPFVCLGWSATIFVFQATVNEVLLHRDFGIGDSWHAPLPNGYQIMMVDVTDQGWVYNRKTQPRNNVVEREDAIPGVRTIQVANPYILAATDSRWFEHLGTEAGRVDRYFILDTRQGKRMRLQNQAALQDRARELGIEPKLRPLYAVYSELRFSWFDVLAGILSCLPPLLGGLLLIRWVVRLRR